MKPPGATRVVVVGQGYVGLPLAMRAAEVGYLVVGYDTDGERVKRLAQADSYVSDVHRATLQAVLDSGRYHPTTNPEDCAEFDVGLITVPTPLTDGVPDLSCVEEAGRLLGAYIRPEACVVLESTTYPGTTTDLLAPILETASGLQAGIDFHLGYSPERIDPGNQRWTLVNTPKLVAGVTPGSLAAVRDFYDTLVERTVPVRGTGEAELAKLIENTFRHVNIALVNELAMSTHALGLDIWEALDAASTKPFGFMRFDPGPGVGGHCLPVDPSYLSWQVKRHGGSPFRFIELANDVNDHMPAYVVERLIAALNRRRKAVNGSRILLLGLAYKADTADTRGSPAIAVAERLLALGAQVRAVDPWINPSTVDSNITFVHLDAEEIAEADAVVLLTPHHAFDYPMVATHARCVLDTRRRIEGPQVEHL